MEDHSIKNVAIYTRFSSDHQSESSISDQVRICQQRIDRENRPDARWSFVQSYEDKAISGTKSNRPGYQAMLRDAEQKRFDVLLVESLDRLTRDDEEQARSRKRFEFWGIRVIGVSDGYDSSHKGHKVQASVRGLINSIYLDDLRDKTHRGQEGKVRAGFSAGGKAYGYRRVPIEHPTEKDSYGRPKIEAVRWEPDEEQAPIVRWIYEKYAGGWSPKRIAFELNERRVPPPSVGWKRKTGRPPSWSPTAIYGNPKDGTGILANPIYDGRLRWNRSKWERNPDTQRRVRRLRNTEEWVEVPVPELRIVSTALWNRVQERLAERANPALSQILQGRKAGRRGKHLFSELLKCATCGGNYIMADGRSYGCSGYINRGPSVCSNTLRVKRKVLEGILLKGIQEQLFSQEGFEFFKKEVRRLFKERLKRRTSINEQLEKELRKVESSIRNIIESIKDGYRTDTMKEELEHLEREKRRLTDELRTPTKEPVTVLQLFPRLEEKFRAAIGNLANLPQERMLEARLALLSLFGGQHIILHPKPEGYLEAEVAGDYAGMLSLVGDGNNGCGGGI